jgi:AraC-like DNA-binding protein
MAGQGRRIRRNLWLPANSLVRQDRRKPRLTVRAPEQSGVFCASSRPRSLLAFAIQIEQNYRTMHSPAEYAQRLHVTPKTLGRIVRDHLGTTPTELIRNRI